METDRLSIRKLEVEDATPWTPFFENNPALKFLALDQELAATENAEIWITRQLWRYKENLFGLMALIDKGTKQLIGQCGLLPQEINGIMEMEIAYHILPNYWGKGYGTEAARLFKSYAFKNNGIDSVISIIHIDNIRSQRVAEKNGMVRTTQCIFHNLPTYIYRANKIN